MSDPFFRDLEIDAPDYQLNVGSLGATEQIATIMTHLSRILPSLHPAMVLVPGDVNSTLAAALVANKLGIPVGHIEAGLRSFDESMPEEVNRRLTDSLSQLCFTHSPEADENLRREGVQRGRIHRVGNLMIDTLFRLRERKDRPNPLERLGLEPASYALLTLHRPSNVDRKEDLTRFASLLEMIADLLPIVFPIHPRTLLSAKRHGLWKSHRLSRLGKTRPSGEARGLLLMEPLGYRDFLELEAGARLVLTDSGGVQEETTVLGVPCLTLRRNTERPITITHGTNRLVGTEPNNILRGIREVLRGEHRRRTPPPFWDGRAGERLIRVLERKLLDAQPP
jgi:UDP-N-acetylglucosamine 2-epimerase (non-hydrolysing)